MTATGFAEVGFMNEQIGAFLRLHLSSKWSKFKRLIVIVVALPEFLLPWVKELLSVGQRRTRRKFFAFVPVLRITHIVPL